MNEHIAIDTGTLRRWKNNLRKALDSKHILWGSSSEDKVEAVEQQITIQISISEPLAMELIPGCTKKDVVEALNLGNNIDYALPQTWVDHVNEITGVDDIARHFVWDCGSKWCPIPVTETGELILAVYNHITR